MLSVNIQIFRLITVFSWKIPVWNKWITNSKSQNIICTKINGLPGFLFKSKVSLWASKGVLFVDDHLKPVLHLFLPLQERFCESPFRSQWYLNSDWNTNALAPKWWTPGLPIQIYCLIMGFQRASLCGRPSEVRVSVIFQAYSNPFVKARPEARGI